ncbi:hypothetical protein BJ973_007225 [Actinoplanes tereljensis]|uniref:Uncharacterized protein n=1 Tax=Paractinoplanes tereljensis TaxID=571912 RepID=A0A919TYK5_9ACTN|nr:hypothetical protein [Actinoplanes tereljensis]GIF24967.1 hypothetical protein Ate02nite_76970 [Actinoplanes tereljensis]
MSRQFRYRITALALGGLIFGAPLLTNGTASAEQQAERGRQVTFGGGGGFALSCRSHPDVESLVIPADSIVRVVNRTGYNARLELSGETQGMLPDEGSAEVVFRRGTTSVTVDPNCPLGEDTAPLLVTASPSATTMMMPDPGPVPSDDNSSNSTTAPSGSSGAASGSAAGTTKPNSAPATTRSTRTGAAGHVGDRGPARRTSTANRPAKPGADQKIKTKTPASTAGSVDPAFAGMPPGDQKTLDTGVPTQLDLTPATQDAALASVSPPPTEIAAAEPVAAMAPMSESRPIGMLAVIAAVCVMGVGAAAIRSIVSQRANRANVA